MFQIIVRNISNTSKIRIIIIHQTRQKSSKAIKGSEGSKVICIKIKTEEKEKHLNHL